MRQSTYRASLMIPKKALVLGVLLLGASLVGQGSYIKLKASLADWLIRNSWEGRSAGQLPARPWPWADTRPVARLRVPGRGIDRYVMRDASGESLAFGPGSVLAETALGGKGYAMIAGHRDTHFKFLSELRMGDVIEIDNYRGQSRSYRVHSLRVINVDLETLSIDPESNGLSLITCWPFDALVPGGPERYLVEAGRTDTNLPYSL